MPTAPKALFAFLFLGITHGPIGTAYAQRPQTPAAAAGSGGVEAVPPSASNRPDAPPTPSAPPPEPPSGQIPAPAEASPSPAAPAPEGAAATQRSRAPDARPIAPGAQLESSPPTPREPDNDPPLPRGVRLPRPGPPNVAAPQLPPAALAPEAIGAPRTALWLGLRTGWLLPRGSLWLDGSPIGGVCCAYGSRPFSDFSGGAPKVQFDLGLRFASLYNVFATWEYAATSPVPGAQQKFGSMSYAALGFRFSSDPDDLGLLFEIALGYRSFTAQYDDGTSLIADKGGPNLRVAVGADWRLNHWFSLSPQLAISTGSFGRVRWEDADGDRRDALSSFDASGQYHVFGLDIGGHFDAWDFNSAP